MAVIPSDAHDMLYFWSFLVTLACLPRLMPKSGAKKANVIVFWLSLIAVIWNGSLPEWYPVRTTPSLMVSVSGILTVSVILAGFLLGFLRFGLTPGRLVALTANSACLLTYICLAFT